MNFIEYYAESYTLLQQFKENKKKTNKKVKDDLVLTKLQDYRFGQTSNIKKFHRKSFCLAIYIHLSLSGLSSIIGINEVYASKIRK